MSERFIYIICLGYITMKHPKDIIAKKSITKKEAILVADRIKSGMSIKVMKDLEDLKNARSKVLMVEQS